MANAIFGAVSVLVIADRTRGTGRFNLVQGALATAVGLGAALSTTFGGRLIHHGRYNISFLALGGVAAVALAVLYAGLPETLMGHQQKLRRYHRRHLHDRLSKASFLHPNPTDKTGVLSWVHLGDLHMRSAGDQNDLDLQAIVKEVNQSFADSISFVFLPGDNADHGDVEGYRAVRRALDELHVPWCAIIGDHDVEQKSFDNFRTFLSEETQYAFSAGNVRFIAINAFDVPEPPSFIVKTYQLHWLEEQLEAASHANQTKVLFLHCYPSDLKEGGEELMRLISRYGVKLVDMGHTHYNEISHDGRTIYAATRSTGQIEEGPVGFSVTNIDNGVVSWRFLELGNLPAVIITTPADERLIADDAELDSCSRESLTVRAKVWSDRELETVEASLGDQTTQVQLAPDSSVWGARFDTKDLQAGICSLRVAAVDSGGKTATDEIRALIGLDRVARKRAGRDQDNALEAWPEHGLLGTQLGPNKNGKKW